MEISDLGSSTRRFMAGLWTLKLPFLNEIISFAVGLIVSGVVCLGVQRRDNVGGEG
jgi:hypothetical protein